MRKQNLYQLYGRTQQRLRQVRLRTYVILLIASVLAFTGLAIGFRNQDAQATPPSLVLGELPYQKLLSQPLTNKGTLEVNAANGNVILKTVDLNVKSVGIGTNVTRYFNNLSSGSGAAGSKDTLAMGADVKLVANANNSVTFQGPSGYQVTFPSNGAGGYTTPAEYTSASLTTRVSGGWKLNYHQSNESLYFNASGQLTSDEDGSGNGIDYTYNANGTLAQITDAQGKDTVFSNYSGSNVGTITDENGRTVNYTYTSGQLTKIVDTQGNNWTFEYTSGNLTEIADPRGIFTTLGYDTSNRVTRITYNDYTTKYSE